MSSDGLTVSPVNQGLHGVNETLFHSKISAVLFSKPRVFSRALFLFLLFYIFSTIGLLRKPM